MNQLRGRSFHFLILVGPHPHSQTRSGRGPRVYPGQNVTAAGRLSPSQTRSGRGPRVYPGQNVTAAGRPSPSHTPWAGGPVNTYPHDRRTPTPRTTPSAFFSPRSAV